MSLYGTGYMDLLKVKVSNSQQPSNILSRNQPLFNLFIFPNCLDHPAAFHPIPLSLSLSSSSHGGSCWPNSHCERRFGHVAAGRRRKLTLKKCTRFPLASCAIASAGAKSQRFEVYVSVRAFNYLPTFNFLCLDLPYPPT